MPSCPLGPTGNSQRRHRPSTSTSSRSRRPGRASMMPPFPASPAGAARQAARQPDGMAVFVTTWTQMPPSSREKYQSQGTRVMPMRLLLDPSQIRACWQCVLAASLSWFALSKLPPVGPIRRQASDIWGTKRPPCENRPGLVVRSLLHTTTGYHFASFSMWNHPRTSPASTLSSMRPKRPFWWVSKELGLSRQQGRYTIHSLSLPQLTPP